MATVRLAALLLIVAVVAGPQHPLARKRRVKLAELDGQP